jgi:Domain of unknown function (DUF4397)
MKLFFTALYVCVSLALTQGTVTEGDNAQNAAAQNTTEQNTPELAAVRLAHVSPDAPLIDLLVDGRLRLQDVNFTAVSSYLILPAGEHELRVFPHRAPTEAVSADPAATSKVAAPEPFIISVTLEPGRYYTLVASGFFDPPPAADQLGTLSFSMTEGTTATVTGPRAYATTVTGNSDLTELSPGTYTITASQEGFKTAQYEAEVKPNETAVLSIVLQANSEGETSEAVAPVPANATNSGLEWRKVQLQLYEDELSGFPPPGFVFVRVIHASPTTPAVSIVLARRGQEDDKTQAANETSEPIITNLSYPNEADYLAVAAGRTSFRLLNTETNQVITELTNLELNAGTFYTFFIVGTRDDDFVSVIPTIDAILAGQP